MKFGILLSGLVVATVAAPLAAAHTWWEVDFEETDAPCSYSAGVNPGSTHVFGVSAGSDGGLCVRVGLDYTDPFVEILVEHCPIGLPGCLS